MQNLSNLIDFNNSICYFKGNSDQKNLPVLNVHWEFIKI